MAGGSIVNTWVGGFSHTSAVSTLTNQPSILPVDVKVANSAGNWLFAIITWDQSAVLTGIQFSTSTNVSDDAHNYWTPVTVVQPNTGVLRTAIWMAPAARPASFVYASQTGYQQAITVTIIEVTATVPWYTISAIANTSTNAGTSITLSEPASTSLFSIGAIAYDNNTATVSFTSTGWIAWNTNATTNGVDHTSDITTATYVATTTGPALTLSASSATTMNWSEVIIAVGGVANSLPITFTEIIQNWPDVIVEMTCGQVLNQNFSFANALVSPWTASNSATLSISSLYTLGNSTRSLLVTPSGANAGAGALSEQVTGTLPYTAYTINAWITVPTGWSGGAQVGFNWFTSGGVFISSTFASTVAVTGSLQQLTFTAFSPATTGQTQIAVQLTGGTPPVTALMFVAYAALAIPGAYGDIPQDQLSWIDVSSRAITQDSIKVSRGIQYENQTLEAGTLELTLTNVDGTLTPGNNLSIFYPFIGDTDINIRVRIITPSSVTPYAVLHRGFTDDYRVQYDTETKYQYASLIASDMWSRMTAQMVTATQQDYSLDSPFGAWPCYDPVGSQFAHNVLTTGTTGPLAVTVSSAGIGSGVTQAFGSGALSQVLQGDSGGTGWAVAGITSATTANGASLTFFPANPRSLPSLTTGVTVQLWVSMGAVGSINQNPRIAVCTSAVQRLWEVAIAFSTGNISMSVYDKATGVPTSTVIASGNNFSTNFYVTVRFTTTAWSTYVAQTTGNTVSNIVFTSGSCNFNTAYDGFMFNGVNSQYGSNGLCFNGTVQDIAIFPILLPPARISAHFFMSFSGTYGTSENFGSGALCDSDLERLGIIASYSGFTALPFAMRGIGVPSVQNTLQLRPAGTGADWMTPATDTNGQIASDYMTNITASTAAALFVDGPGALVYRRRAEWYALPVKWTMGELPPLPLNLNPFFNNNVLSWTAANGTFTFSLYGGQFGTNGGILIANGTGVTTITSEDEPATQGNTYAAFCSINATSLSGYTPGTFVQIVWLNSGHTVISSVSGNTVPLPSQQWTNLFASGVAPAGTAFLRTVVSSSGTPGNGTPFALDAAFTAISPGEAPYMVTVHLAQDRAQLFNSATVTQFGTQTQTVFRGASVQFQPSSGVIVTAQNTSSVANRGNVPYVATSYLSNTVQNPVSFLPNTGAVEDFASWIVFTLGQPSFRVEQAEMTPVATLASTALGFFGELGDTVVLNRRSLGSPTISFVAYLSRIEHDIDIKSGKWNTSIQLSPNPNLAILTTDNPAFGTLDGINRFGW